jgi:hypothetical protein
MGLFRLQVAAEFRLRENTAEVMEQEAVVVEGVCNENAKSGEKL